MWLHFANADALARFLRQTPLSRELLQASVRWANAADGSLWLQGLRRLAPADLRRLSAHAIPSSEQAATSLPWRDAAHWGELLALRPQPGEPPHDLPRIIESTHPRLLVQLADEAQRLATPWNAFRWTDDSGNFGYLLRGDRMAITLQLRLAEWQQHGEPICTFVRQAEGLWVEARYQHPFPEAVRPHEDWLVDRNGRWRRLPKQGWFALDQPRAFVWEQPVASAWHEIPPPTTWTLPLQLVRNQTPKSVEPSLWLIEPPMEPTLRALAEMLPQEVLEQLEIAVMQPGPRGVLRAKRPIVLPELAERLLPLYAPVKLTGVGLPIGWHLQPALRRDVLRRTFAVDGARWLCLRNAQSAETLGERIIELAYFNEPKFRPVFTQLEHQPHAVLRRLQPLVRAGDPLFALRPFAVPEPKPQAEVEPPSEAPSEVLAEEQTIVLEGLGGVPPAIVVQPGQAPALTASPPEEPLAELPWSDSVSSTTEPDGTDDEAQRHKQLFALEQTFLDMPGEYDSAERCALWPRLAQAYAELKHPHDAGICWLNAWWTMPREQRERLRLRWERLEFGRPLTPETRLECLDRVLTHPEPDATELTRMVLALLSDEVTLTQLGVERIAEARHRLEAHEERLPIRLVWIAALAIARLCGGDLLGLLRTRDRILNRLLSEGLHRESNLPTFLRSSVSRTGDGTYQRLDYRQLRDVLQRMVEWAGSSQNRRSYAQLIAAWVLQRLGDRDAARQILAQVPLPRLDSNQWNKSWARLFYEDKQVLALFVCVARDADFSVTERGYPRPWAEYHEVQQEIDRLMATFAPTTHPDLRDPFKGMSPFRRDPLEAELAALRACDSCDAAYAERVIDMFRRYPAVRSKLRVLLIALPAAFRGGPTTASRLLEWVAPTIRQLPKFVDLPDLLCWVRLTEVALTLAAYHDRTGMFGELMQGLFDLLEPLSGERAAWLVGALSAENFRCLHRLGLEQESRQWMGRLTERICADQTPAGVIYAPGANRPVLLPALARLVGGWLYLGETELARSAMQVLRQEISDSSMSENTRTKFACDYVAALRYASPDLAVSALRELFERLLKLPVDEFAFLNALAGALTGEDFQVDERVRRWIDLEEHLIRKRIHADVRAWLAEKN